MLESGSILVWINRRKFVSVFVHQHRLCKSFWLFWEVPLLQVVDNWNVKHFLFELEFVIFRKNFTNIDFFAGLFLARTWVCQAKFKNFRTLLFLRLCQSLSLDSQKKRVVHKTMRSKEFHIFSHSDRQSLLHKISH